MKIVADENIVDAARWFGEYGDVFLYPGRSISPALVADADVLLVRSITAVDRQLLTGSQVSFVGSATIGHDHIDRDYLDSRNIPFAHAPGCNASAVVQYVIAVLCCSVPAWRSKTVAIIGCGHVGGKLLNCLQSLDVKCKVYDPFLNSSQCSELVDFPEAMMADIICLHTPLTRGGPFPSYHMIDKSVLTRIAPETILINAGRGAVIDNRALLSRLDSDADLHVVLDVWEGEPNISLTLLDRVLLGTPHIAGHSVEGKRRGTQMLFEAFCRWQNLAKPVFSMVDEIATLSFDLSPGSPGVDSVGGSIDVSGGNGVLENIVLQVYNPYRDHELMTTALGSRETQPGQSFDGLRRNYKQRWEFSHYRPDDVSDPGLRRDLLALGFNLD